jgi:hypothetical protein
MSKGSMLAAKAMCEPCSQPKLPANPKFKIGQVVEHRDGSVFRIMAIGARYSQYVYSPTLTLQVGDYGFFIESELKLYGKGK